MSDAWKVFFSSKWDSGEMANYCHQENNIVSITCFSIKMAADRTGLTTRHTAFRACFEEKNRQIMQEDEQRRIILPRFVQIRAADASSARHLAGQARIASLEDWKSYFEFKQNQALAWQCRGNQIGIP
ncbi:hypothetical protein [Herbaspirillum sp. alder98]|uniref:hypothetical protein n=1 Tax=Herbaspirillum sp. alder98 TaxID=2913096 RepID=UPI001CD84F36|nr:hypothetical protein [Herbaspirillum sp. alder98]MCA1327132.1 hypothetical protein [Herbaspirillum sp. alder98]